MVFKKQANLSRFFRVQHYQNSKQKRLAGDDDNGCWNGNINQKYTKTKQNQGFGTELADCG